MFPSSESVKQSLLGRSAWTFGEKKKKMHALLNIWKRLGPSQFTCSVYSFHTCSVCLLSSQITHHLGSISTSVAGLSDVEENSTKWQLYSVWTVHKWTGSSELGMTGNSHHRGWAKDQGILQMRQDINWKTCLVSCNRTWQNGHDSQVCAGRQENSHCTARRELAFTIPKGQVLSSQYRGTAPHTTGRDNSSSEAAQSSDFPPISPPPQSLLDWGHNTLWWRA